VERRLVEVREITVAIEGAKKSEDAGACGCKIDGKI